ncbi:MAG: aspartate aminotransferase family protein [Phaeodactylibacter sp.]|nr:aspartate aminotransferase family protein [Phaeodactylibacter sp.]
MKSRKTIPMKGQPRETVLANMEAMKSSDPNWAEGRTWSLVYHVDDEHRALLQQTAQLFISESYANPFAVESIQQMELDIIGMAARLLHGEESTTGTMTSGGTESILLTLYTYREWARSNRTGKKKNELVAPATIHPAFEKAAHLLGLKVRKVPLDNHYRADIEAMEKLIGPKTLLLAVSAPAYPHGTLDPIEKASALALRYGLPLHVDACIGGFFLPWVEKLNPGSIPPWDFRLAGVTSISADTHKFGYGAKGSSVLLFRSMNHLRHQFFITTDWPGGIYASSTLLGSRSAIPIATAWAAMHSLGQEGYQNITHNIMDGCARLRAGIEALPEMETLGQPCMNILAFTTRQNKPDIFVVADFLEEKGWIVDRQQRPHSIHLTVMQHNLPAIGQYLHDLKAAIAFAQKNPQAKAQGSAAVYGLMARIPFRSLVASNVRQLFEDLYAPPVKAKTGRQPEGNNQQMQNPPAWMGWLNRLLSR